MRRVAPDGQPAQDPVCFSVNSRVSGEAVDKRSAPKHSSDPRFGVEMSKLYYSALIFAYTILAVPYYNYSIFSPKPCFNY